MAHIVQHVQGFTGIATTITVNFPSNVTKGNAVILVIYQNVSPGTDPAITCTDTFTQGVKNGQSFYIYYVASSAGGYTSIQVSNAGTNLLQVQAMEVSGLNPSNIIGAIGHSTGTSAVPSVSTSTSALAGDFIVACFLNDNARTYTADSPFVIDQQQSGSFSFNTMTETQTLASTGTVTAAPTPTGSADWFADIAAFHPVPVATGQEFKDTLFYPQSDLKYIAAALEDEIGIFVPAAATVKPFIFVVT